MARDPLREEIEWLTRGIRAIRIARFGEGGDMALELKGLKSKALTAAGHIGRLNQAYDKFNEAAPAHAADVEGLLPQIEALGEDLAFAAQVLGNSAAASSGGGEEKPSPEVEKPATFQKD